MGSVTAGTPLQSNATSAACVQEGFGQASIELVVGDLGGRRLKAPGVADRVDEPLAADVAEWSQPPSRPGTRWRPAHWSSCDVSSPQAARLSRVL